MLPASNIQFIQHTEIDKSKWDNCIEKAANGLIYGYSFYLDIMSENWDALVLNDYEAVMPLTWKKKYGIKYLYQPFLTAQSGVFGNTIAERKVDEFIHSIPDSFRYIDISLNAGNITGFGNEVVNTRVNYVLNLNKPYPDLKNNYKENMVRNIKKAEQTGFSIEENFNVEIVIKLAIDQMKSYTKINDKLVNRFRNLYQYLKQKNMASTFGIKCNNIFQATCVFFNSHNRYYYILVGNHSDGKTIGASHALIDAFIKEQAGSNKLLDFEGSDIPGLALFYRSFGADTENYSSLKINRLPFYIRWLKN